MECYALAMPRLEAHRKVREYERSLGYSPDVVYFLYLRAFEDEEMASKMKAYADLRKQKSG